MFRSSSESHLCALAAGSDATSVFSSVSAVVATILETAGIPVNTSIHYTETGLQVVVGHLGASL